MRMILRFCGFMFAAGTIVFLVGVGAVAGITPAQEWRGKGQRHGATAQSLNRERADFQPFRDIETQSLVPRPEMVLPPQNGLAPDLSQNKADRRHTRRAQQVFTRVAA